MQKNIVSFDKARFTVLTEQLIRMEYSSTGHFEDNPTQIVQNREFPEVQFEVVEKDSGLEIITDAVHLYYTGDEFTERSLYADMRFAFKAYGNRWHYGQEILGNLGGTARTLDRADGACELEDGIMSKNGFSVLTDDGLALTADGADITGSHASEIDLYLFAYGREYRTALKDFYQLTGATPRLPRFALGNWWSRYYEYSAESYLALMEKFEAKGIPLSVSVIDMDWHRVDDVPSRFGSGWTGYSWNKNLFPDPKAFIDQLHAKNLKVTLNDHPADGIRAFEDCYDVVADKLGLDKSIEEPAVFDFDNPEYRQIFFDDVHGALEDDGVDFWWLDWQQGTVSSSGADPLWLLNHYQYRDSAKKADPNIILSRYAGPGSHRYPVGFSGDTVISWESLDFQPYFTSTATNIGYTWWSHDIGGHMRGTKDAELTLRWVQYGVFSPINRLHSSKSEFTIKEPWRFDAVTEAAMTKFLRLRHALIPYLYTANLLTASDGKALVEPLYYAHPLADEAYKHANQYYFGSELMVAPITQKSDAQLQMGQVSVWFPEGIWYDVFTGQRYEGDSTLKIFREKTEMPVFAKAGAIIPLDKIPLAREEVPLELTWQIFPGADGSYTLLEDDNQTEVRVVGQKLTLTEQHPSARKHTVIYAGREIASALTGDFELDLSAFSDQFDWDFDAVLFERLDHAEIAYALKDEIYATLRKMTDFDKRVVYINQLENPVLKDMLFELIYSDKK